MAKQKWTLDPTHSELQFKVKHLMISTVTGSLKSFSAELFRGKYHNERGRKTQGPLPCSGFESHVLRSLILFESISPDRPAQVFTPAGRSIGLRSVLENGNRSLSLSLIPNELEREHGEPAGPKVNSFNSRISQYFKATGAGTCAGKAAPRTSNIAVLT